jgi:hypothetical protein
MEYLWVVHLPVLDHGLREFEGEIYLHHVGPGVPGLL